MGDVFLMALDDYMDLVKKKRRKKIKKKSFHKFLAGGGRVLTI